MDEITSVFVQESREQLAEMESCLLGLEQNPDDPDKINAIFRAAHTIKGGAGVIECHFIEAFTHRVENVLDALRNGALGVTPALTTLLLGCCDHMLSLIDLLAAGEAGPAGELQAQGEALGGQVQAFLDGIGKADEPTAASELTVSGSDPEVEIENAGAIVLNDSWHVSVRFGENVMRGGVDPLSFIRYLGALGEILAIVTVTDAVPAAAAMDPESCYLGFEVRLQTRSTKEDIERVFDFVRDECELRILPPNSRLSEYLKHIQELPEDSMRLGEILVRCGALTQTELEHALSDQKQGDGSASADFQPLGEILVDHKVVSPEVV
ncbi:MAG TPA: Hpt domain-containing protein, partial [Azonexus sp.]|nr:Hpt domain-containing protein [Azonexus sp.]